MIISAAKKENKLAAISVAQDIWKNRSLIRELAKNDFKKKFAGSYFGILWAFVSPIISICVYWFVFTVGMRNASGEVNGYPFVLWLIAGIVPWFLFSEILSSGTDVLLEYAYLVKKIVFNISILPVIKVITATVIHLILLLFTLLLSYAQGIHRISTCCRSRIIWLLCGCFLQRPSLRQVRSSSSLRTSSRW